MSTGGGVGLVLFSGLDFFLFLLAAFPLGHRWRCFNLFCLFLFSDKYRARATRPQPRIKKRAKKTLEKSSDGNPPALSYSIETHPDTTTERTSAANSRRSFFIPKPYYRLGVASKHGACGYRGRRSVSLSHSDLGGVSSVLFSGLESLRASP